MTCLPHVWVLALLSLQGISPWVLTERLSLKEGQNLDLHCVNNGGNTSALEWKDPGGFTIFFNDWRVTRDGRYELLHYSENSLSIRLSNITRHDEGLFTCLYYSDTIGSKLVSVTVWAPPSKPLLEVLRTPEKHTEENLVLSCSTDNSWPAPQITWLLQNGVEIFGNAQHQLEAKRFCSVSNLTIYSFPQGSLISCVIHHKARGFVEGQANFLFPGLVSMLLLALFIVVLLFVVKLWKAHRDWKKENNSSEQPIESYRPKANEAPCRLKKNICTIPWRNSEKYVIQEPPTRTPKPSEESQDSSVFEKEFSHFKEMDI